MKNIVIVGAGIAGLTAGIYARRSGLDVTVIEQHTVAGGMCTSWRRKGYLFEGAMHWLTGSSTGSSFNRLWREVGALDDSVKIELPPVFLAAEYEGKVYRLYRDMERNREEWGEISPADEKAITQLCKDVKKLSAIQAPVTDIKGLKAETPSKVNLGDMAGMMPAMLVMKRLQKLTVGQYLEGFQHPGIKMLLGSIVPGGYAANSLLFTLATLDSGDGGYPEGGSLGIAERMKAKFLSLGGTLRLGTKVEKVVLENGKAAGVQLQEELLRADAVIVAAELNGALNNLFDTIPADGWLQELYTGVKPSVCTFVGIGLKAELPDTPMFRLEEPIRYAGLTETVLGFNNYHGYAGYAPAGCTVLTAILMGDSYDFWKKAKDEGRYEAEKEKLGKQIERALCGRYPQLEGKIDVTDIATPVTYERYTAAYHGSWMTLAGPGSKMTPYPGYLDSIQGLYFAGQRLMPPGGMPGAVMTGRTAAQLACRQFDAVFKPV